jgi:hypothetical protein
MYLNLNITAEHFRQEFLYKQPKLFKGAAKDVPIDWQYINELYQRANPVDELFRLRKGEIVPVSAYVESFNDIGRTRYRFNKAAVYEHLRKGATIVYNRINNEPLVDAIAKQIAQFVQAQTVVSGYLAFGSDASFKNHWDTRDVFAVQLMGKKHWSLYAPNFEMPLYMQQSKDVNVPEPQHPDTEVVLEAGDMLYIPRGWWHSPVPMNCETFHLAIGTFAPTGYQYMEWLMKKVPSIVELRHNLNDWQSDQNRIQVAAQNIAKLLVNRENYETFKQEFLGDHRADTAFNMQIFGNPHNDRLPENGTIKLNSLDNRTITQGYVIANGIKTNLDNDSQTILQWIADQHYVELSQLHEFCQNQNINSEKVNKLIFELAMVDVLEFILP